MTTRDRLDNLSLEPGFAPFDPKNPPAEILAIAETICDDAYADTGEALSRAQVVYGMPGAQA